MSGSTSPIRNKSHFIRERLFENPDATLADIQAAWEAAGQRQPFFDST